MARASRAWTPPPRWSLKRGANTKETRGLSSRRGMRRRFRWSPIRLRRYSAPYRFIIGETNQLVFARSRVCCAQEGYSSSRMSMHRSHPSYGPCLSGPTFRGHGSSSGCLSKLACRSRCTAASGGSCELNSSWQGRARGLSKFSITHSGRYLTATLMQAWRSGKNVACRITPARKFRNDSHQVP